MSEQENETQAPDAPQDETLAPAEDAEGQPDAPEQGHASTATDLPEGAEIDPLTDQQPVPVEEKAEHDG